MKDEILLEKLKDAGAHLGYSKSRRHPSVRGSLYSTRNSKDIINLEETVKQIQEAGKFLATLTADKKQILFVGVKPEARMATRTNAMLLAQPYATERFIGGTLTNFSEIKKRLDKLTDLTSKREKGELSMYTKKEQSLIDKDIARMNINFGGLLGINGNPAALVLVDSRFEKIALTEAKYTRLPVVALCNTDCDIKGIKYPIIVNEASAKAVAVVLEALTKHMQSITLEK